MRRECQEILPALLLGPFQVSKDLTKLKELGVTHMYVVSLHHLYPSKTLKSFGDCDSLCIRDVKEAFSVRPRFPDEFTYMTLDVEDNEEQNLIRVFPQ